MFPTPLTSDWSSSARFNLKRLPRKGRGNVSLALEYNQADPVFYEGRDSLTGAFSGRNQFQQVDNRETAEIIGVRSVAHEQIRETGDHRPQIGAWPIDLPHVLYPHAIAAAYVVASLAASGLVDDASAFDQESGAGFDSIETETFGRSTFG